MGPAVILAHCQPQQTRGPSWSVRWNPRFYWLTANPQRTLGRSWRRHSTSANSTSDSWPKSRLADVLRVFTCLLCVVFVRLFVDVGFTCGCSRVGVSRVGAGFTFGRCPDHPPPDRPKFRFFFPLPPHFRSFFSSRPEFHEEPWGHWVKPGGCRPPGGPHFFWIWPPTLRAPLFLGWGSLSRPPCVFSVFLGCFLVVSSPTPPHSTFNEALPFVKGHGPYLVRMRPSLSVLSRNILFLGCSRVICGTNRN